MDDVKLSAEWCATEAARCDRNALLLARTPSAGVMPRGGYSPTSRHAEKERLKAQALRIASRVLDPGAEEKMARIIDPAAWAKFDRQRAELVRLGMDLETERGPWMYVEPSLKAARAVLAWMRGEMGSSSAITAGSACGANEAQHSDGEG